jgi:hypothetical protein
VSTPSTTGLRHELVARTGCDLLDRVAEHGKWPDKDRRWCTSDFKRGPIRRVITALVAESRAAGLTGRQVPSRSMTHKTVVRRRARAITACLNNFPSSRFRW